MQTETASLVRRLCTWYHMWRAARAGCFSANRHAGEIASIQGHVRCWLGAASLARMRVLDIGCGQKAAMTCLLAAAGAHVTGIDVEQPTGPLPTLELLKLSYPYGLERTVKSLARRLLGYDYQFYKNLNKFANSPIKPQEIDLRVMDAAKLDFPDSTFDLIYSAVAFEHVANLPAAVREIWRVCEKPRGLIIIRIHLFASISGGHNPPHQLATNGGPLPPWAHLFDEGRLPSIYLNRLRLSEYLQYFGALFNLREVIKKREPGAEKLLTAAVEASLPAYSREDLLTQLLTIIATPRSEPSPDF